MIWIYGGSFNPPTKAHFNIINSVKNMFPKDQVYIIPVGDQYKKKDLEPFNHRVNMLLEMDKNYNILKYEKEIYEGTYHTLLKVKKDFKCKVGFIIGSDLLINIPEWIEYKKLCDQFPVIIIKRPKYDIIPEQHLRIFKNYRVINLNLEISSKKIRNNMKNLSNDLHPNVLKYIKKNLLYEVKNV